MIKKKNRISMLFSIAAIMCLFGLTQAQPQNATDFSGRAVNVIGQTQILGQTAAVNINVNDTGTFDIEAPNSTSRSFTNMAVANINLSSPASADSRIVIDAVTATTFGGPSFGNTSQSLARVNDTNDANSFGIRFRLINDVAAVEVSATTVEARTFCRCGTNGPLCSGDATIENLIINGQVQTILDANGNATVMPEPNTTITVGAVTVILNEQVRTGPGDITVNAIRIIVNVPNPIPGGPALATGNVVISQATSGIECDGTIPTTAASAIVGGRVLTSKARGLPGATVVLTDQNGQARYALTNSRGFYNFSDIEVGKNYFLSVRSKRYGFTTRNVFVTEDLTDLDFMPSK